MTRFTGTASAVVDRFASLFNSSVPSLTNNVLAVVPRLLGLPASTSVPLPDFTVFRPLLNETWNSGIGGKTFSAGAVTAPLNVVWPFQLIRSRAEPYEAPEESAGSAATCVE